MKSGKSICGEMHMCICILRSKNRVCVHFILYIQYVSVFLWELQWESLYWQKFRVKLKFTIANQIFNSELGAYLDSCLASYLHYFEIWNDKAILQFEHRVAVLALRPNWSRGWKTKILFCSYLCVSGCQNCLDFGCYTAEYCYTQHDSFSQSLVRYIC